jgi:hypothetical protein
MGKFSQLLNQQYSINKLTAHWMNKGRLWAIRSVWLGIASNLSVLTGIIVSYFTASYSLGIMAATGFLAILLPLSILISYKRWEKEKQRIVEGGDNRLNPLDLIDRAYEEQLQKIEALNLSKSKTETLKIEAYHQHQTMHKLFQSRLLSGQVSLTSVKDAQLLLEKIQSSIEPSRKRLKKPSPPESNNKS